MTVFRKMMCLIVLPTLVIYVVVLGMAGTEVYVLSRREVQDDMASLATNYAARFDGYLREAAMIAEVTARFMDTQPAQTEDQVFQQLRSNVERMPLVYGAWEEKGIAPRSLGKGDASMK